MTATGLVTSVGFTTAASCAAIRGAVDHFQETRFRDEEGEWIIGAEVQLPEPSRGEAKLLTMVAAALAECLSSRPALDPATLPLLLYLAESDRPGRMPADATDFLRALEVELGVAFHARSRAVAAGHVSLPLAFHQARQLLGDAGREAVLVGAVDSLLTATTMTHYAGDQRLLSDANSNGFIPGEAAGALLLERAGSGPQLVCRGIGFGVEKAHFGSNLPLRADGLTRAIRGALDDAGCSESILHFKIIDASGEQRPFKEASLAFSRLDRTRRTEFEVWHPADCVGETGAALGPVMVAVLKTAFEKGYARGRHVLMHLGNDDGRRGALIFSWTGAER